VHVNQRLAFLLSQLSQLWQRFFSVREQMVATNTGAHEQPVWSGWWRPTRRSRWRLVVTDADERRCHDRLLDSRRGGDFLLRAPGASDPNQKER
jgi:hypothetical protein